MKLWFFDSFFFVFNFSATNICPCVLTSVIFSREAHANSARPDLRLRITANSSRGFSGGSPNFTQFAPRERTSHRQTSLQLRRLRVGVGAWNNSWRISTSLSVPLHRLLSSIIAGLSRRYKSKEREKELVIDVLQIHRVRARKFGILFRQFEPNPAFNI